MDHFLCKFIECCSAERGLLIRSVKYPELQGA